MNVLKFPVRMRAVPAETLHSEVYQVSTDRDHWKGYIAFAATSASNQYLEGGEFDAEL